MNLMEIGKKPEMHPTGTADQTKNSETITESLTQPLQTPEESPIKLKVERDILVQSFKKAKEFMRTQKKQIQTLEEEKQTIVPLMAAAGTKPVTNLPPRKVATGHHPARRGIAITRCV